MFSSNATQVSDATFIEDVFSTWLYTGTGATQTINNGIDLAGRGGLVWMKGRSGATDHALYDTARGATFDLVSNSTAAQTPQATGLTSFGSTGFSIGSLAKINTNAATYASWTFREQPRFFDIVTYTGNGANQTIAHNLQSVPGCIMVKRTDTPSNWAVYHRRLNDGVNPEQWVAQLNTANSQIGNPATVWNSTAPTATNFSVGGVDTVNANGGTYVAYLFAHDAGGFGATGADNVISCGSYTGNGASGGPVVTLGWEPQWLLIKRVLGITLTGDWNLIDNMRGFVVGGTDAELNPNLSNAESTGTFVTPTATGFQLNTTDAGYNASGSTYIYIAIRRGPMRTPTTGTSVFAMDTYRATSPALQSGFVVDMFFNRFRSTTSEWAQGARLIGDKYLILNRTDAEAPAPAYRYDYQNGVIPSGGTAFPDYQGWMLRRAPGFFDVVCYTGTGANRTVSHNLGVAPELMIVKSRSSVNSWPVYAATSGAGAVLLLNGTGGPASDTTVWNNTAPTASVFSLGTSALTNASGTTYVAYLFASCPGVSRVGSYTGTGATQTINCGFAAGARFVLIKRTDSTGDWYVWDSVRGIVAANDPYLVLNSTAAEVTTTDWVDTAASGFELSNAAGNLVNTNGGSYIFLAIA